MRKEQNNLKERAMGYYLKLLFYREKTNRIPVRVN